MALKTAMGGKLLFRVSSKENKAVAFYTLVYHSLKKMVIHQIGWAVQHGLTTFKVNQECGNGYYLFAFLFCLLYKQQHRILFH
jgi:hypothetical protein